MLPIIEKKNHKVIEVKNDYSQSVHITTVSHYENESDSTSTIMNEPKSFWSNIMGNIYADDDPQEYSTTKKNIIIFIIALSGISCTVGNMIYMPDVIRISQDLNTTLTGMSGTVSVYVVFLGLSPLLWASISDTYGRKPVYMISLFIGIIASILCAISTNVTMLIIFRAIQACGASAGQTLGAGVIADIFVAAQRGKAYGIFYVGPLLGHVIGPTIGGVLCQYLEWRSTFYFLAILAGVLLSMVTFVLPETLRKKRTPIDEKNTEEKYKLIKNMQAAFIPMILMLGDRTVLLITLYNTVIHSCFYFLTPTMTETFQSLYGYTSSQIGTCYIVYGIGLVIGSVISGRYADFIILRLREKKGKENVYPEMILRAAFPSFILIPAGYLIYGWTTEKTIPVYAPLTGLFLYSIGQMCAFTPSSIYLVDSKPGRSASAVAINNCVRSVVASITTIVSSPALHALGPGILFTIIAVINIIDITAILLVMAYGKKWRTQFEERTSIDNTITKTTIEDGYLSELCIVNSRISSI